MSWDFSMLLDSENSENSEPVTIESGLNYTCNVAPMFYEALQWKDGIRELDGKTGTEALSFLYHGLKVFESHPSIFRSMNPKNGWGDYDGAVEVLKTLIQWGEKHPRGVYRVS